jgi:prevent-host-death family protein
MERVVEVGVHEAKSTLSDLIRRVAAGEEVTITRSGEPVARLVPVQRRSTRTFGADRGRFEVPDDFNAPLPDDLQRAFEG